MSPQRLIEHVTTEAQGRGDVRTELMTEQLSTIYIYPICYHVIGGRGHVL